MHSFPLWSKLMARVGSWSRRTQIDGLTIGSILILNQRILLKKRVYKTPLETTFGGILFSSRRVLIAASNSKFVDIGWRK